MLLRDKIAIVTGAASLRGIGWATAQRFAQEGARVALLDLDGAAASRAAGEIGDAHRGYACDVRDAERCKVVVEEVIADLGKIDILINNAGVSQAKRLMDSTMDDYDLVFDVSLRGAFNMSRAIVPHFRSRRSGNIVCMGSIAAQRGGGVLGGPHYAAAKGGVQTLAKAMARELAPDGIRVNAVAPGLIDTELLQGKITDDGKQAVADSTPMGRLGLPLDIANAFLFLASDLSSYVTGVVLDVNGGLHIH
ncbi:SDR family NAD(P)-dependent oxidoreductase [Paraburkholderia phosphatilytica]|uniref:SDR family NAD(P)-dependent oxidoreductase n=1 Tax=Paraburkholderia phosphatilytica TaxID=2282883 RepID=UPI000E46677B|nr:SDR family NAD(P)-dependent oxidoreductase [Paraburkholderia phosphatilytica]